MRKGTGALWQHMIQQLQALASLKEEHAKVQAKASKSTADCAAADAARASAQSAAASADATVAKLRGELEIAEKRLEQLQQESMDSYEEVDAARCAAGSRSY